MSTFVIVEDAKERQLLQEVEVEQVVHIDLAEYQVGSPRYERLYEAMQMAKREEEL